MLLVLLQELVAHHMQELVAEVGAVHHIVFYQRNILKMNTEIEKDPLHLLYLLYF